MKGAEINYRSASNTYKFWIPLHRLAYKAKAKVYIKEAFYKKKSVAFYFNRLHKLGSKLPIIVAVNFYRIEYQNIGKSTKCMHATNYLSQSRNNDQS